MEVLPTAEANNPPADPVEEKTDWIKITGIVIMVMGALAIVFAFFCLKGTFPVEFLGGKTGVALTCFSAVCVITVGGAIFFVRRKKALDASAAVAPQQP